MCSSSPGPSRTARFRALLRSAITPSCNYLSSKAWVCMQVNEYAALAGASMGGSVGGNARPLQDIGERELQYY